MAIGSKVKAKSNEEGEEKVDVSWERPFAANPEWKDDYDQFGLFVMKTLLGHEQVVADEHKRMAQFKS
jgi:hypothetical protein